MSRSRSGSPSPAAGPACGLLAGSCYVGYGCQGGFAQSSQYLVIMEVRRVFGAFAVLRYVGVAFWREVSTGLLAEEAEGNIGVAPAVATRWYRRCGGMRPVDPKPSSGGYLSCPE